MAITPQAIKDQEFQVKFRGYDTVEVKAYLELIAEEFFELLEQVRQQIDELDVVVEERDALQNDKLKLQEELEASQGDSEEIKTEFAQRDTKVASMQEEIDRLKDQITSLEQKCREKDSEIDEAQAQKSKLEQSVQLEKQRNDKLGQRLDDLEKQNEELRSEELDFKSTLKAAQQFTSDLKKKSESEAREIIGKARSEAEKLRQDTFAELARYPAEIERLKKRRNKVRDELEAVLNLCLENLDIFREKEEEEDYGELFEKIKLAEPDYGNRSDDDGQKAPDDDLIEDLDALNLNFDLPESGGGGEENVFSMKKNYDSSDEDYN